MEELLYWLSGGIGVPIINAIKLRWALSGRPAMWLSAAVAALLALIASLLTRQFTLESFGPEDFFAAFGQVLASATVAYKLLAE